MSRAHTEAHHHGQRRRNEPAAGIDDGDDGPCCEKHAFRIERSALHMLDEQVKETSLKVWRSLYIYVVVSYSMYMYVCTSTPKGFCEPMLFSNPAAPMSPSWSDTSYTGHNMTSSYIHTWYTFFSIPSRTRHHPFLQLPLPFVEAQIWGHIASAFPHYLCRGVIDALLFQDTLLRNVRFFCTGKKLFQSLPPPPLSG